MKHKRISHWAASLVLVTACGAGTDNLDDGTTTSTTTGDVTTSVSNQPTSSSKDTPVTTASDPGLEPFVDQAVADLANRLDTPESEIEVVTARLVTWPDASLGCPQPDMQYAQVLTDGALIELRADEQLYSYHMGGDQYEPFLCEEPGEPTSESKDTETIETPYGDLVVPGTEDTVPPPGYDD